MAKSDLEKAFEALPDNPKLVKKWSVEEDALLIKHMPAKGGEAIAKLLGISGQVVRRRYQYLLGQMKKK